nr:unknown protein [Arabidopsis thaliana]
MEKVHLYWNLRYNCWFLVSVEHLWYSQGKVPGVHGFVILPVFLTLLEQPFSTTKKDITQLRSPSSESLSSSNAVNYRAIRGSHSYFGIYGI